MKKQVLLAIAGGALMMAAPKAHAAVTLVPFTTANVGTPPSTITVSGTIPEYIEFTKVDQSLELGDLGGAVATGTVQTVTRNNAGNPTLALTKTTSSTAVSGAGQEDGTASVEFKANTFVKIVAAGTKITGLGADGAVGGGDDVVLPTGYRVAVKGRVRYNTTSTGDTSDLTQDQSHNVGYGTFPSNSANLDTEGFSTYGPATDGTVGEYNPAGLTSTNFNLTFAPGGGYAGANAASGFKVAAEFTRNGLADYKGNYSATIGLTYFKF